MTATRHNATRLDGHGKVELRETHPEIDDTAELILVDGADVAKLPDCVQERTGKYRRDIVASRIAACSLVVKRDKGIASDHASAIFLASEMKLLSIFRPKFSVVIDAHEILRLPFYHTLPSCPLNLFEKKRYSKVTDH